MNIDEKIQEIQSILLGSAGSGIGNISEEVMICKAETQCICEGISAHFANDEHEGSNECLSQFEGVAVNLHLFTAHVDAFRQVVEKVIAEWRK